jgi:hypothetical protein
MPSWTPNLGLETSEYGVDRVNRNFEIIDEALAGIGGGGVETGTAFPTDNLTSGRLFYRTDEEKLYAYNGTAQAWVEK